MQHCNPRVVREFKFVISECNGLQHIMQHTGTHCSTMLHCIPRVVQEFHLVLRKCNGLQHTLQHTAARCSTMQQSNTRVTQILFLILCKFLVTHEVESSSHRSANTTTDCNTRCNTLQPTASTACADARGRRVVVYICMYIWAGERI